jgi:hypothetical protein
MKVLLLSLLLGLSGIFTAHAAEMEAVQAAKVHLKNILTNNAAGLQKSYAKEVTLMPGHEFTKPEYGLANDKARKEAVTVTREALVDAIAKKLMGRPKPPEEKLDAKLGSVQFEALESNEGDFAVDAADEAATSDGKFHFKITKNDVVLKVSPPNEDFAMLHLRKVDERWVIVSEYLD